MTKIYLAAPLFSEADKLYNEKILNELEKEFSSSEFSIYAPQRNASINDKTKSANSIDIFHGDTRELIDSNIMIACLDGLAIDPGVAAEIGWFAGWNQDISHKPKIILGLLTDSRDFSKTFSEPKIEASKEGVGENQFSYANLYVVGAVKKYGKIVSNISELIKELKNILKEGILL